MSGLIPSPLGAYSFIPGSVAFSLGAIAAPGWSFAEIRPTRPWLVDEGLTRLVDLLSKRGLSPDSVVGLELRSPEVVGSERFAEFNDEYRALLVASGVIAGTRNPVTRTNAVPVGEPLAGRSIVAAHVVRPDPGGPGGDYVLSGIAEDPDGTTVAPGDTSPMGLAAKAATVVGVVSQRLRTLGADDPSIVNVYCADDLGPIYAQVLAGVGAREGASLRHWRCVPPLEGLAFEVDCRRLSAWERVDG